MMISWHAMIAIYTNGKETVSATQNSFKGCFAKIMYSLFLVSILL